MMSTDKFSEQADIAFDLPELIHNLELLIDITEEDLIQNNKKFVFYLYAMELL